MGFEIRRLGARVWHPGPLIARADAAIAGLLPADATLEQQRRARVLVVLVAVFNVAMAIAVPFDAWSHAWGAVALQVGWGAFADVMLVQALKRGRIAMMGHAVSGILVVNLTIIAQEKGGLVATEIAWQCAAILFSTLVLGPRGALLWTVMAMAALVVHVRTFDPTQWHGAAVSFTHPVAFGIDVAVLYLATWGLAYGFDRARAEFFRRLEHRTRDMRRVLDHASDALLTIDREGRIGAERSARAEELLERPRTGSLLWDVLAADPENGERVEWLRMGWESVLEDMLPREVVLESIPRRVVFRGRTLELRLTLIEEEGVLHGALVVLHDVTEELARERAEQARRETLAVFEHVRTDPSAVADFVKEMDRLVESATHGSSDGAVIMRDIHTIKGNSGLFGLESMAALCDAIEDRCARAESNMPTAADRALLAQSWLERGGELREWCRALNGGEQIVVSRADLADLHQAIASGAPGDTLSAMARGWELTPIDRALSRLARRGEVLAKKMGKEVDFEVVVDPPDLRVDADVLGPVLSSLAHAVRNGIDHGISAAGTIELCATLDRPADVLVVEVADDGEGIAWELVREKAKARGLPSKSEEDLVNAILGDGFSTRSEVTSTSGRGVGLAGIRQAAAELGGSMTVSSQPGRGSRFQVRIPIASALGGCAHETV